MKKSTDSKRFDDALKSFDENMKLHPNHHQEQKNLIVKAIKKEMYVPKRKNKWVVSATLLILLLFATSPFYSHTMAGFIAKLVPIEIKNDIDSKLSIKIQKVIEKEGYQWQNVGTSATPFSIDISLIPNQESLDDMKAKLLPEIKQLLADEGIDDYQLNITKYKNSKKQVKESPHQVKPIIKKITSDTPKWPIVVSNIQESLVGRSAFKVKGISYKEKKDITYIEIRTGLKKNENTMIIIKEIEIALEKYLQEERTKMMIQDVNYEIIILDKEKNEIGKVIKPKEE